MSLFHSSIHCPGTLWLMPSWVSFMERSTQFIMFWSTTTVVPSIQGADTLLE